MRNTLTTKSSLEIKPVENGWVVYEQNPERFEMVLYVFVTPASLADFVEDFYKNKPITSE